MFQKLFQNVKLHSWALSYKMQAVTKCKEDVTAGQHTKSFSFFNLSRKQ